MKYVDWELTYNIKFVLSLSWILWYVLFCTLGIIDTMPLNYFSSTLGPS